VGAKTGLGKLGERFSTRPAARSRLDDDSDAEYGAAKNKMCPDEEPKTAA
jgi:hypothetical protein